MACGYATPAFFWMDMTNKIMVRMVVAIEVVKIESYTKSNGIVVVANEEAQLLRFLFMDYVT
jgi:hypothetical protein